MSKKITLMMSSRLSQIDLRFKFFNKKPALLNEVWSDKKDQLVAL